MLKQKNYPKVYLYDGASYTEVSFFMLNFGRDALELQLDTDDFIYFGKHKPFNSLFVEMGDNITSANAPAANAQFHVSGHGYFRLSVAGATAIQTRSETNNTAITLLTDAILRAELI